MLISSQPYRDETPGVATKVHFNNAGSSLMPSVVIKEIHDYIDLEGNIGGYEAADLQAGNINNFYAVFAKLIGAKAENIAYTSSATNSFARALSSINFREEDVVIIAREDYISNQFAFLSLEQRHKIRLIRAPSLDNGGIDLATVESLIIKHSPRLVSLSHVPSNTGLIQPAAELGRLCEKHDVLFLLDACQSVGQIPVNVQELKCDFLCATMRKFLRGPRGAGFLYVSDKVLNTKMAPLFIDLRGARWTEIDKFELRSDAKRFEDGEVPYALLLGATRAAEYALEIGLENIMNRNRVLCDSIRNELRKIQRLRLLDETSNLSSIITVGIDGIAPSELLQTLRSVNINTSISYRDFALPDFDRKKESWALRISPHYYNDEEDIRKLIDELSLILTKLNS